MCRIRQIKCHGQGTQLNTIVYVKSWRCIEIITDLLVFRITPAGLLSHFPGIYYDLINLVPFTNLSVQLSITLNLFLIN
jgi:hypothetical protein